MSARVPSAHGTKPAERSIVRQVVEADQDAAVWKEGLMGVLPPFVAQFEPPKVIQPVMRPLHRQL
jgi:hypothetical protein